MKNIIVAILTFVLLVPTTVYGFEPSKEKNYDISYNSSHIFTNQDIKNMSDLVIIYDDILTSFFQIYPHYSNLNFYRLMYFFRDNSLDYSQKFLQTGNQQDALMAHTYAYDFIVAGLLDIQSASPSNISIQFILHANSYRDTHADRLFLYSFI